ncbi:phosphoglycerate kinase [Escherichia coli]
MLENSRFNKGEKKNTEELAKKYAALCDVFVMDAFGTATAPGFYLRCGSICPDACAGPLLAGELEAWAKPCSSPSAPWLPSLAAPGLHQADRAGIPLENR